MPDGVTDLSPNLTAPVNNKGEPFVVSTNARDAQPPTEQDNANALAASRQQY